MILNRFWGIINCLFMTFMVASCGKIIDDTAWLDSLHEQGWQLFCETIATEINNHPEKGSLTDTEIEKIRNAGTNYERLYELLMNVFYQKEEPEFISLLQKRDTDSRKLLKSMYLNLARFSARQFVTCFFVTDGATEFLRKKMPVYEDMDVVDLVLRSIGYDAKLDPVEPKEKELSPEFEKQMALDAGRFREAHKITKGKGAKIAILDTGIDPHHPVFNNTVWGSHFSLVGRTEKPWEADATLVDWGEHGTLISSVAACYAPEAQITVYKFSDGSTQNDPPFMYLSQCMIAAAIYKAVHDGNDVISISASGGTIDVDYLRKAVEYAHQRNRIVVSGNPYSRWYNEGFHTNFPGQYETVISVTAAQKNKDGSYNYWPVCAAYPHTGIAVPNDIFGAFPTFMDKEDTYIPSISAAIPAVSALAAMVISVYPPSGTEAPGEYADIITKLILENAKPEKVGFTGFSEECGYGLIDAHAAVKEAIQISRKKH